MNLEELKRSYVSYNTFDHFIEVASAKKAGLIPASFAEYFDDKCACGSTRIISYNLRQMQCVDPRCPIKQGLALHNLFTNFECKGVGEQLCVKTYNLVRALDEKKRRESGQGILQTKSYVEILALPEETFPIAFRGSAAGDTFLSYKRLICSRKLTFADMISKLGIPEMGRSANNLFKGINNIQQLLDTINKEGGVNNFCEHRGVHDNNKKFWLYNSLTDIYVASSIFSNIRPAGLQQEDVCITGSIFLDGNRMTKKDFVAYCNELSNTPPIIDLLEEVLREERIVKITPGVRDRLYKELSLDISFDVEEIPLEDFIAKIREQGSLSLSIQIFDVCLSTAKMSVRHIIADSTANTDKYRTGLMRGSFIDEYGATVKVLVSSKEYVNEIERRKSKWIMEYKEHLRTLLQEPTLQKMSL